MTIVQLGDKVKCKHTGFIGIAMSRSEFINGCVQYGVVAKWDGKSPEPHELSIDENSLEVIKPKPKPRIKKETGGPMRRAQKVKGF